MWLVRFKFLLIVLPSLILFGVSCVEDAPRRICYLAPWGDDSGEGTADDPWATLEKASGAARPGDTFILLPGVYEGGIRLSSENSGTADAPVVFKAAERRLARITGGPGDSYAVLLHEVSHVTIEGLHIQHHSEFGRWFNATDSSYIDVVDCLIDHPELAARYTPSYIHRCEHVRLLDNRWQNARGDMLRISFTTNLLMEGNAFSRSGHGPVVFRGVVPGERGMSVGRLSNRNITIRGNVFHAGWGRAFGMSGEVDVLFENNIIANAFNSGMSAGPVASLPMKRGIFRYNRVFRNWGGPLSLSGLVDDAAGVPLAVYNNVFDDNYERGAASGNNVEFFNNVFYRNDRYGACQQLLIGGETNRVFTGNFFGGSSSDGSARILYSLGITDKVWRTGESGITGARRFDSRMKDLTEEDAAPIADVFFENRLEDPGFVNPACYDHAILPESPLRDAGMFLSRASESGRGPVIKVEEAYRFYDGHGLKGERGDVIAVGRPDQRARIERIDLEAGELFLDRALVWDERDPVSLPWSGAAPDAGVYEYGGGRALVRIDVERGDPDEFVIRPGVPVILRADVSGIEDVTEFLWQLGDGGQAFAREVAHVYDDPGDYPIRLRVTDKEGRTYRGVEYLVVEDVIGDDIHFLHSTFNADDRDWWWLWKTYRPYPARTTWTRELDEETGEGFLNIMTGRWKEYWGIMPAQIHPAGWDIDKYPIIEIRYRVIPGTPVGIYLRAFDDAHGVREVCVARAPSAPEPPSDRRAERELVLEDDTGEEWNDIVIDARWIREQHPEVQILKSMYIEARAFDVIEEQHAYHIGEVIIRPE